MRFKQFVIRLFHSVVFYKPIKYSIPFFVFFLFSCNQLGKYYQKSQDVYCEQTLSKYEITTNTDLDYHLSLLCENDSFSDFHIFMECRFPSVNMEIYSIPQQQITEEIIVKSKIKGIGEFKGHTIYIHQFENCTDSIDYTKVLEDYYYYKKDEFISCDSLPKLTVSDSIICKKWRVGIICILEKLSP